MDRDYVESTMIRSIGFAADTSTLEIEFNSGAVWQYYDFPESLYYEFRNSESLGKFFHGQIKNNYREARVA